MRWDRFMWGDGKPRPDYELLVTDNDELPYSVH